MAAVTDETLVRWADGTEATLGEVRAGEFAFMSDDYEVVLFPKHALYKPSDFTDQEYYEGNGLAKMVIDGGLGICKNCGACEIELDQYPSCADFRDRPVR